MGKVEKRVKELLFEKAQALGISIESLEIMPDHIHLFIKTDQKKSISKIVGGLKGYTSKTIRKEFPNLKQNMPALWTRSYYCESIGHISEKSILKYIADQKRGMSK